MAEEINGQAVEVHNISQTCQILRQLEEIPGWYQLTDMSCCPACLIKHQAGRPKGLKIYLARLPS